MSQVEAVERRDSQSSNSLRIKTELSREVKQALLRAVRPVLAVVIGAAVLTSPVYAAEPIATNPNKPSSDATLPGCEDPLVVDMGPEYGVPVVNGTMDSNKIECRAPDGNVKNRPEQTVVAPSSGEVPASGTTTLWPQYQPGTNTITA